MPTSLRKCPLSCGFKIWHRIKIRQPPSLDKSPGRSERKHLGRRQSDLLQPGGRAHHPRGSPFLPTFLSLLLPASAVNFFVLAASSRSRRPCFWMLAASFWRSVTHESK
eukprot:11026224-Heterocapsa_arctica.AAC.1